MRQREPTSGDSAGGGGRSIVGSPTHWLEGEGCRGLQVAVVVNRSSNLAGRRRAECGVRGSEVWRIESIEGIEPEADVHVLVQLELALKSQIPVFGAGAIQDRAAGVAIGVCDWDLEGARRTVGKSRGVDGAEGCIEEPHRVAVIDLATRSDAIWPAR